MTDFAVWHGTPEETSELVEIVARNCACGRAQRPPIRPACSAHQLLLSQRMLDGLLFARRLAPRLRVEEFGSADLPSSTT